MYRQIHAGREGLLDGGHLVGVASRPASAARLPPQPVNDTILDGETT